MYEEIIKMLKQIKQMGNNDYIEAIYWFIKRLLS